MLRTLINNIKEMHKLLGCHKTYEVLTDYNQTKVVGEKITQDQLGNYIKIVSEITICNTKKEIVNYDHTSYTQDGQPIVNITGINKVVTRYIG